MTNPIPSWHEGLALIDNLLSPESFKSLHVQMTNDDYRSVHQGGRWNKVWRLWDGDPHRGSTVLFNPPRSFNWQGPVYPTSTPMDIFIDALREATKTYPEVVGSEGVDWIGVDLCPWIYPPGSALSLHWDTGPYTGGFTYFLHYQWGTHWGGELIVGSSRPLNVDAEDYITENGDENSEDNGIGLCIRPKSNRLVLIGPSRPHRVARVDSFAGTHVRLSIAGFFLRRP
jgi:Rps23 Pro-64 3,4-dihydroxylase Tpa1-like proline 4-hydroxylase